MQNKYDNCFGRNGTEGMLDVILACTLIFILISCLINVGKSENREKVLPAVKLSGLTKNIPGMTAVKKNIISLKFNSNSQPDIYLDDKKISLEKLKYFLNSSDGIISIALRRDNQVSCNWEDKIIMLCREVGIQQVGIVIREGGYKAE